MGRQNHASQLGGSICEEIPLNPKEIDTKGFSTESVTVFHAF